MLHEIKDMKGQILHDSTYMKYLHSHRDNKQNDGCSGFEGRENGNLFF
jgi:hypothetical protein